MPRVISEKNLTYAEALEILLKEESSRELTSIERYTLEYLRKFSKVRDAQTARSLVERLMKEFDIPEDVAVQIVNVKPADPQEAKIFVSHLNKVFTDKDFARIIEILSSSE
ncbi:DNA-directed RNA polymerase, subunit F [Thermofilum pendens Hrk 5]|uniref:DNA-directed RNA polymerase subunit Rpo4 n=1 Tax=Thermofilum pendens (strain DSM 2475 / Hrk 5) TaxID=368408 RepID=A1RX31_THEPD|nr:DNA-directed RNA polymerase, subunit F [Thermofilum pendens Hrk 5]